jgi:hypothetical protein
MMNRPLSDRFKENFAIKPVIETLSFFRAYVRDIVTFLLYATVPVIIIENFISYYAMHYNFPFEIKHLPIIVHFLYQPIYTGGLIFLISKIIAEEGWDVKRCLLVGLRCWVNLLLVNIISSLMIIFGLFAFIIPGLFIFARLSLAEFSVVLERLQPTEALYRSYKLSRGFTWQIITSALLLSILLLGFQLLIHLAIVTFSLESIITFMITELLIIILWSTFTILFFRFYDLANKAQQQSLEKEIHETPTSDDR